MRIFSILITIVYLVICATASAQNNLPKGFKKAAITLLNGSTQTVFIKDNIRSNASLTAINTATGKKENFDGSNLISVEIDNEKLLCIQGDFFKVISNGNLNFLQKYSDASGKISYNGAVAVSSNGTEGKIGDYFFYIASSKELKQITSKNFNLIIDETLSGCASAQTKAKLCKGNIADLKIAVELFNNCK